VLGTLRLDVKPVTANCRTHTRWPQPSYVATVTWRIYTGRCARWLSVRAARSVERLLAIAGRSANVRGTAGSSRLYVAVRRGMCKALRKRVEVQCRFSERLVTAVAPLPAPLNEMVFSGWVWSATCVPLMHCGNRPSERSALWAGSRRCFQRVTATRLSDYSSAPPASLSPRLPDSHQSAPAFAVGQAYAFVIAPQTTAL